MNRILLVCGVLGMASSAILASTFENEVSATIKKMSESNAESAIGYADDSGVFVVCIGRDHGSGNIEASRERARLAAVSSVGAVLGSKTKCSVQMFSKESEKNVKEYFSSQNETTVDACLKGVRVIRVGKDANGENIVVVVATAKDGDASSRLEQAINNIGDKGVVVAVGVASSRALAEKNALRSAVEQVAGTMVTGKVSMTDQDDLHKRLATTAGALVEEYRITKDVRTGDDFTVEVAARVSKRALYDSYRSYFKAIDNPTFYVAANDPVLKQVFSQYFIDKGFNLTECKESAQYVIVLDGNFSERPNPISGRDGTMLSLSVSIASVNGGSVLLKMNEQKSKDSEVLSKEQRIEAVSKMIFKKIHSKLDEKIHDMVIKMLDDAE